MFAVRSLRIAARPLVQRRGYAEAASGAFKLSLVLPHEVTTFYSVPPRSAHSPAPQTIFKGKEVFQVNISADAGDMG